MSTTTANLGLFKYTTDDHNVAFDYRVALNNNWDSIDAFTEVSKKIETTQNVTSLVSGTINLSNKCSIYSITPSDAVTFTFSTTNLTLSNTIAYTFELYINMSTAYALTFPESVVWESNTTPNLSSIGIYFMVFRTIDNGTTWLGNLQGKWEVA